MGVKNLELCWVWGISSHRLLPLPCSSPRLTLGGWYEWAGLGTHPRSHPEKPRPLPLTFLKWGEATSALPSSVQG